MSKKNQKLSNLQKFTAFAINEEGTVLGGFSGSLSVSAATALAKNKECVVTNNCDGGNCATNCGVKIN